MYFEMANGFIMDIFNCCREVLTFTKLQVIQLCN